MEYQKISVEFRDMMIHDFDMVLYLGEAPNSVMAYGSNLFTNLRHKRLRYSHSYFNYARRSASDFQILGELPMVMTNGRNTLFKEPLRQKI